MTQPRNYDVIVAVCTYNRNKELAHLLGKIESYAPTMWPMCRVGVTVIDDSADGSAKGVANAYAEAFPLGLSYENSASRNISIARNLAVEKSIHRADWVAMTDDDCEPSEQWLSELFRVYEDTEADVVTGLMLRRAPENAPSWIKKQPFLELGEFSEEDGGEMPIANTNNSLISSRYLLSKPNLRFDPQLGRLGGEDMAFFHSLKDSGAKIVFAANAFVFENEPPERLTLQYQMRRYLWQGNSSCLTCRQRGVSRRRMVVNGIAKMARAGMRPLSRLTRGSSPQFLFALAGVAEGIGILAGVAGIKVMHK